MKLDEYQQEVVKSPSNISMKVVGAPGSGKTRTLVSRYIYLCQNHNINPKKILALTFSKKAAIEMQQRISQKIEIGGEAKRNISTIHAFCYRLYNSWRTKNGKPELKIWQYGDRAKNPRYVAAELMSQHLGSSDMSVFDYINKILSSEPKTASDLLIKKMGVSNLVADRAYKVWVEYQTYLKKNNLTDFNGQIWNVDRLIGKNEIFTMMTGSRFDKIICDEAQDLSPQSYRIITKLAKYSSLEVFGDPSQSIYSFNDAAPHLFYEVEAKPFSLLNNYRSSSKIVEVVNNFGPLTTNNDFNIMNCMKTSCGDITIAGVDRIESQADYIADEVDRLNHIDYKDMYVLARTNAQCSIIHQRLTELGVPSYYPGIFDFWDKNHIKAAIGYVAIVKSQDGADDLEGVINIPSPNSVSVFGRDAGKYSPTRFLPRNIFMGKTFKDLVADNIALTRGHRPGVSDVIKFIEKLRDVDSDRSLALNISEAILKWAKWSGLDAESVDDDLSVFWDKLEDFDYDIDALRNYIQKMRELKRKDRREADKVQVMTIHQAKGLEAIVVFLTGLSEPISSEFNNLGFHPGRNTSDIVKDENCLYYVGISRAIKYLYLTYYLKSVDINYKLSSFVTDFTREVAKNGNLQ